MNEYLLLIVLGDGSFEGGEAATDNPYEYLHLSMSRPRAKDYNVYFQCVARLEAGHDAFTTYAWIPHCQCVLSQDEFSRDYCGGCLSPWSCLLSSSFHLSFIGHNSGANHPKPTTREDTEAENPNSNITCAWVVFLWP